MDDSLLMRRIQGVGNLPGDAQGLIERQARWRGRDDFLERLTVDELEDQAANAVALDQAVDAADVGVIHGGEQLRLPAEPNQSIGILRHSRRQHFDGDLTPQFEITRPIDLAHPTLADSSGDDVRPQRLSDTKGGSEAKGGDRHAQE